MKILVLRPHDQGRATARRLAALGHEAIVAPVLTIEPTGTPLPAGSFAGTILTSANALPVFRALDEELRQLPVWAVGSRVAEALGSEADVVTAPDAAALARTIRDQGVPGPLLFIAGTDRKAEPEATLRQAGVAVATWETYRAAPATALPEEAKATLRAGSVEAALHYSRRSAEIACGLVRQAGLDPEFAALRHLCLSPDVASGLAGLDGQIELAPQPDEASLLALLPNGRAAGPLGSRPAQSGC